METKLEGLEDDLARSAPLLSSIEKINFYEVPQDYFQKNELKLVELAQQAKATKVKKRTFQSMGMAACLIGLCFVFWTNNQASTIDTNESLEETEQLLAFLEEDDDIDLDILLSLEENTETDLYLIDLDDNDIDIYWDHLFEDFTALDLLNTF